VTYVNEKQFVVIGLKERVIHVVIFGICITWMISTIVQLFKYMLGKMNMTKRYGKMTSAVADIIVKYGIGLDGTISDVST